MSNEYSRIAEEKQANKPSDNNSRNKGLILLSLFEKYFFGELSRKSNRLSRTEIQNAFDAARSQMIDEAKELATVFGIK